MSAPPRSVFHFNYTRNTPRSFKVACSYMHQQTRDSLAIAGFLVTFQFYGI